MSPSQFLEKEKAALILNNENELKLRPMLQSECPGLTLLSRGKVRDLYEVDNESLLFVASDRISAFDVIMKNAVPGKGRLLTSMSIFWFKFLENKVIPHHFITSDLKEMPKNIQIYSSQLEGRCMLVKKLKILPVEAIVREYLAGSLYAEYLKHGTLAGVSAPLGLSEGVKLEEPIFTPSTKAMLPGQHDESMSKKELAELIGIDRAKEIEESAIKIFKIASDHAKSRGLCLADTKFEFGVDSKGVLHLADEVLTPDSSRYWIIEDIIIPSSSKNKGSRKNKGRVDGLDKQHVRDYLRANHPDLDSTGVELPQEVIIETMKRYERALSILTN